MTAPHARADFGPPPPHPWLPPPRHGSTAQSSVCLPQGKPLAGPYENHVLTWKNNF